MVHFCYEDNFSIGPTYMKKKDSLVFIQTHYSTARESFSTRNIDSPVII